MPGARLWRKLTTGVAAAHKSLKGQLLLDGGQLHGGYFRRTVVLICEHKPDSAFGLVLNRPSEAQLKDVFDRDLPTALAGETLHSGGPVEPAALSYLWADMNAGEEGVIPGLQVGHELEKLIELGEKRRSVSGLRVFAGYAGWSKGQLDAEMRREAWVQYPASLELIFQTPAADLWRHVLRQRGGWKDRLLADSPEDPSCN